MKLTVLGGSGAWPTAEEACSGFLVEHDGFRLLMDVGYATLPRLLGLPAADRTPAGLGTTGSRDTTHGQGSTGGGMTAGQVDAVLISHGHPDHCADLNPLLRARTYCAEPAPPLPVYTLPGALDAVLALDRPGMLDDAYVLHDFQAGDRFEVGPFTVGTRLLPHSVPNAGLRLTAGGRTLTYTGDSGPSPEVVTLARDADLLVAEATFLDPPPGDAARYLGNARQAGSQAAQAGAARLLLTHLQPGTDPDRARETAAGTFPGRVGVASGGLTVDLG
ncbi:MBL fold metallo-hydrolase [Sphaerisporangium corydalis]|uniref:MBL fold metallo-hydrolase n=1 Tax=Sphaerisporangium corydalis TaxID=1441875 RepID=A0ABV9EST3_9ACTN|nr:MBL fold metallo-hydrolase [Sphaerisporangium corydalis]